MRRLARYLFVLLAATSLLLCVAVCAMWIRSLVTGDLVVWNYSRCIVLRSDPGLIFVNVSPGEPDQERGFRYASWRHASDWSAWRSLGPRWWDRIGFGHYVGGSRSGQRVDQFVFPHYAVVVLTAILPGFVGVRWLFARRRRREGLCRKCGYDLRGGHDRCPECGTPTGAA